MKKITIMVCCVILSILSIAVGSLANTSEINAFVYPESIEELFITEKDIHIFHYYNGIFVYWIGQGKTLEELTSLDSKECALETLYVYYGEDPKEEGVVTFSFTDGQYYALGNRKGNMFFASEIENNSLIKSQIKQDFLIENIVCLSEEASYGALLIYYVTDIGDYILFKENAESEDTYLFPIADFRSFAAEYYEWLLSQPVADESGNALKGLDGNSSNIESIFNISKYSTNKATYLPRRSHVFLFVFALVLLIAFILTAILFMVRRKNNKENS